MMPTTFYENWHSVKRNRFPIDGNGSSLYQRVNPQDCSQSHGGFPLSFRRVCELSPEALRQQEIVAREPVCKVLEMQPIGDRWHVVSWATDQRGGRLLIGRTRSGSHGQRSWSKQVINVARMS